MLGQVMECPRCSGLIPPAHQWRGDPDQHGCFVTSFVCAHCSYGADLYWDLLGDRGGVHLAHNRDYRKDTEPGEFNRFVRAFEKLTGVRIDFCLAA